MSEIIVLSWHKKGFPMADYYADAPDDYSEEWPPPDGYKTGSGSESMYTFRERCSRKWPGVQLIMAEDK